MDANWAVVWATFIGPIGAVLITIWRDRRSSKRERRMQIFRSLMATRKININIEHVKALNLIEIEFYKVISVETAWKEYIVFLNSVRSPDQQGIFEKRQQDLLAKLITQIGDHLGYRMGEIDVRDGGYAPEGWRFRDNLQTEMQLYVTALAKGNATLPVAVQHSQSPKGTPDA
jgi:hypothetical protein